MVTRGELPTRALYKYFAPERLSVLRSRLLRFTPPEEFNDPFDVAPVAVYGKALPAAQTQRPAGALGDIGRQFGTIMQRQLDALVNRTHLNQTLAADSRGVLCLSESCTSLLMWAHYGASHRGFALGLDGRHPWLAAARPVAYSPVRPTVHVTLQASGRAAIDEDYLYRKSDEWCYEKEWRLVRALVPRDRRATAVFARDLLDGQGAGPEPPTLRDSLFKLPCDALSSIVIGARMADCDRALLARLLAELPRLRVSILQSSLDPHTFRLQLHEVRRQAFVKRHLAVDAAGRDSSDM